MHQTHHPAKKTEPTVTAPLSLPAAPKEEKKVAQSEKVNSDVLTEISRSRANWITSGRAHCTGLGATTLSVAGYALNKTPLWPVMFSVATAIVGEIFFQHYHKEMVTLQQRENRD